MEINNKIKELLFKYWKENGVDTNITTLSLFGIPKRTYDEIDFVQSLVIDYYGGRDEVLKKLKKLEGGILYGDLYNGDPLRGKVFNVVYDKGEQTFFCSVLMDGDVKIEVDDGVITTIYDEYMDEGLDREFSGLMTNVIEDMLFEQITLKTGIDINLSGFEISEPENF
jgi:hypothetical protein